MKTFIITVAFILICLVIKYLEATLLSSNGLKDIEKIVKFKPYKKSEYIFTKNEFACYKNLKIIADKHNFEIFSKVRFADIVSVKKGNSNYTKWFNKIKAKHIDFVLLDNTTMQPKLLIELDDKSHDTAKRKERDKLVDTICDTCDIKILHTRNYKLDVLENDILNTLNPPIPTPNTF